jgi:hypothetical protein
MQVLHAVRVKQCVYAVYIRTCMHANIQTHGHMDESLCVCTTRTYMHT